MEKKEAKSFLLDFPVFTLSPGTMITNNHPLVLRLRKQKLKKYSHLEDLDEIRNIEQQNFYRDWSDEWQILLADPSDTKIRQFRESLGGFRSDKPLKSVRTILNFLTLISDKPDLFDKKLFIKVVKDSGLNESDVIFWNNLSSNRINGLINSIDNLGFNTMVLFEYDTWNYRELIELMGADYIIKHQYYSICQQIVINNVIPGDHKSYNKYLNKEGSNEYRVLD